MKEEVQDGYQWQLIRFLIRVRINCSSIIQRHGVYTEPSTKPISDSINISLLLLLLLMMRSRRSCSSQRKATHSVVRHIHAVFFFSSFNFTRQRAIATWILLYCPDSVQLTDCLSFYLSLVPRVESSQQILLLLLILSNIYDRFCHNDDKVYNSNNKYNSRIEEEQQSGWGESSHDLPSIPSPPVLLFFLPLIIE